MQDFLKAIQIEKWCKFESNNFRIEKRDWYECQEFLKKSSLNFEFINWCFLILGLFKLQSL